VSTAVARVDGTVAVPGGHMDEQDLERDVGGRGGSSFM